jgi:hypothetical protein
VITYDKNAQLDSLIRDYFDALPVLTKSESIALLRLRTYGHAGRLGQHIGSLVNKGYCELSELSGKLLITRAGREYCNYHHAYFNWIIPGKNF